MFGHILLCYMVLGSDTGANSERGSCVYVGGGGRGRGVEGSVEPLFDSKCLFSWVILDKFDKFWTVFPILLYSKVILQLVNMCKIVG